MLSKISPSILYFPDRYWHSTAAYTIATEINGKVQDLPPAHDEVYQWPGDLLKPDLVLLLTVDPEERVRRLQCRGLEKTKEEAELEANTLFRQRYILRRNRSNGGNLGSCGMSSKCPTHTTGTRISNV